MKSRKKLNRYIRSLADLMGLRDWEIWLGDNPPDGHPAVAWHVYGGSCEVVHRRHAACIRVHDGWVDWPDEQIRYVMVHELLHCHFAPIQEHHLHAEAHFSKSEWVIFDNTFDDAMEHHIDALATAWAQMLPLPE